MRLLDQRPRRTDFLDIGATNGVRLALLTNSLRAANLEARLNFEGRAVSEISNPFTRRAAERRRREQADTPERRRVILRAALDRGREGVEDANSAVGRQAAATATARKRAPRSLTPNGGGVPA